MTQYVAKTPDAEGYINWSATENSTWTFLYQRQWDLIRERACNEYIRGLEILDLPPDRVPQLPDVNRALRAATGWEVAAVPALIPFGKFFELLSERKFPAATFIRTQEEIDYLQEPDIFHEIFGHCPLLTDPVFADFVHEYGKLGLAASPQERVYLARIFWFTVEFGLIRTAEGLRIFGAGILSSPGETLYSLESNQPQRLPFDVMTALRTPYRIDIFQRVYFVIDSFRQIFDAMNSAILPQLRAAIDAGDYPAAFPPKPGSSAPGKHKAQHDC